MSGPVSEPAEKYRAMPEPKVKRRRLHISGITPAIVESDLISRLQKYGKISKVDGLGALDANSQVRRFAFVTLSSTKPELDNCLAAFKSVKWKGSTLSVTRAKKGAFEEESKKDRNKAKIVQERTDAADRKRKRSRLRSETDGYQAKDVDVPITDGKIEGKREWKKTKYGRAVRVMKLTREDGTKLTFDPSINKDSLQKLYGKAIGEAVYSSARIAQSAPVPMNPPLQSSSTAADVTVSQSKKTSKAMNEPSEITSVAELEKSIKEEKSRNASILQAMFGGAVGDKSEEASVKVNVDDGVEGHDNEEDESGEDDESEEMDKSGQEAKSDGRVDLNKSKHDVDEEEESSEEAGENSEPEEMGEETNDSVNGKTDAVNGTSNDNVYMGEDTEDTTNNVQMKSLKTMFTPGVESERFSLFAEGDDDHDEKESEPEEIPEHMRLEPIKQRDTNAIASLRSVDQTRLRGFESKLPLFFFHLDEPALLRRSTYDPDAKFSPTMTMEEIIKDWESRRLDLTRDFKAKAKEARKYSRRRKARRGGRIFV